MPSPDRADLERLLRLGLSLRQAAGALRVHLETAQAAPAPVVRRPVVRRAAKAVNGKARAIAAG
jgi:hypothetical protein